MIKNNFYSARNPVIKKISYLLNVKKDHQYILNIIRVCTTYTCSSIKKHFNSLSKSDKLSSCNIQQGTPRHHTLPRCTVHFFSGMLGSATAECSCYQVMPRYLWLHTLPYNVVFDSAPLCENAMTSTKLELHKYCTVIKTRPSHGHSKHVQKI